MSNKKKVLVLSDHALSTSGVGTQTRHLINGLLEKDCWTFRQFGAALKHNDYRTIVVNEDFVIKPIDGFGSREMLRVALATEKPDALLIFTDPRFFIWLFEMEDEIHQMCPIIWWHVWDNTPFPKFNNSLYAATDTINCHSHHTYSQLLDHHGDKVRFIPHTVPKGIFKKLPENIVKENKAALLGNDRIDNFVGIWVNRNAKRKRSSDVLESWKIFLEKLEKNYGHKNATLIMHCDPHDPEGANLVTVAEMMKIHNNVIFSSDRLEFDKMNILYNIMMVLLEPKIRVIFIDELCAPMSGLEAYNLFKVIRENNLFSYITVILISHHPEMFLLSDKWISFSNNEDPVIYNEPWNKDIDKKLDDPQILDKIKNNPSFRAMIRDI